MSDSSANLVPILIVAGVLALPWSMYEGWWRLLESADEYMPGRIWWPYYGLALLAAAAGSYLSARHYNEPEA